MRPLTLTLLAAALCATLAGCRYDPVAQEVIDDLGDEKGEPSANHRSGQPCLACHSSYEGAEPAFAVAGTVFGLSADQTKIVPVGGILVTLLDSAGHTRKACSNKGGNFWVPRDKWEDVTYPLSVDVPAAGRAMTSLIGRDGSCASCHKLPTKESFDPLLGTAHDSAGVILVDPLAVDVETCGGAP